MSDENLEVWMTSGGLNHIPQQDVPAEQDKRAVKKLVNTRVFHKLHFAKKKDAIPVRTPHGCI